MSIKDTVENEFRRALLKRDITALDFSMGLMGAILYLAEMIGQDDLEKLLNNLNKSEDIKHRCKYMAICQTLSLAYQIQTEVISRIEHLPEFNESIDKAFEEIEKP